MRNKNLIVSSIFLFLVLFGILLIYLFKNNYKNICCSEITVSVAEQPVMGLIFIAEEKGFFKEEGLNVNYKRFLLGRDALDDTINGGSDIATVYETPFIIRASEGENISAISMLHTSSKNTALVANKEKGINNINDIKGKTIGVTENTSAEFFIFLLLISEGINPEEVNYVNVNPNDMVDLLVKGKVDAIVAWNPFLYQIRKSSNPDNISLFYSDAYLETSVLAVNNNTLPTKSEDLIKFLRALVKAEIFYNENPEESLNLVALSLPSVEKDQMEDIWDDIRLNIGLNNVLLTLFEREAKWYLDKNIYDNSYPNVRGYIDSSILLQVKPESVTIN
jgi:ABC-type nitrate/sulfonate/bicarbonate transport system substrate-binding protein